MEMNEAIPTTSTIITTDSIETETSVQVKLKPIEGGEKKVAFTNETVDNENMNKKKSKCCCIYEKQRLFDESSSEDDDDCPDHCHAPKTYHKRIHKKLADKSA